MTATDTAALPRTKRFAPRLGPAIVALALVLALASFAVFTGYTPILPTDGVVLDVFAANAVIVVILLVLVGVETLRIVASWRARVAGARLHLYIIGLFSIIAAVPAIIMAVVGSVTLERGLYPAFMQDVRGFISHTADAARLYRETQCHSLLRESDLTASDLDRAKVGFSDRNFFQDYFASRVHFLGFTTAVMMKEDGSVVSQVDTGRPPQIVKPSSVDFEDAKKREPVCFVLDEGKTFVALRVLPSFDNTFLYLGRPVDPFAVEFDQQAKNIIGLYDAFDQHRRSIQFAFISMYGLLALIMLLSAIWLGLSFANTLIAPIRRLIRATDQVSSGNLYVQVPIRRAEGDLAHLGETFNKMTSELRHQRDDLTAASEQNDRRRRFTEAVLSGVSAGVMGVDGRGTVTIANPSAEAILGAGRGALGGEPIATAAPEIAALVAEAGEGRHRPVQQQITIQRGGRERTIAVRVTGEQSPAGERGYVVTLDDITDLVTAQRTSAWADVARRIAHEIKNPLTPIQLSAERIRRKYGKVIVADKEIFEQCTDTIVRQVDDIKRMVDEFAAFARMPKPAIEKNDLAEIVRQAIFLMRVAHPDIRFTLAPGPDRLEAAFDGRLLSQALTNILKNATEAIAAVPESERGGPAIDVAVTEAEEFVAIAITDTGKGFPVEGRQRLLEPYMTTREGGTGLGLAIVSKILEEHGGGIELDDNPHGRGGRVRLRLRRAHEPADQTAGQTAAAPRPVLAGA